MNYFFLTFKDPKVEEQYQIDNQHQKRLTTFIALSFGFIVAFLVKVVQAILQKSMNSFYLNLIMLTYLVLQLFIIWKKNKYLRIGIVIFNHIVTIFFISVEDRADVDNQMAMLQGVNQMAVFYLLLLTGEYTEGMVTIIILQIYRIIWGIMTSSAIQYSALITSTLLIVYINYFNYQYNKAKRAQYLLSLADSRWEEILQKLSLQQSYLILQFKEENLHFSIKQFRNCEKLFTTVEEAGKFLKTATFQNVALENIIYRLIKTYKEKCIQNFNNEYLINYQKRTIRTEISLYQGDSPTIMIQFKDFFYQNKINPFEIYKQYYTQQSELIQLLSKQVSNNVETNHAHSFNCNSKEGDKSENNQFKQFHTACYLFVQKLIHKLKHPLIYCKYCCFKYLKIACITVCKLQCMRQLKIRFVVCLLDNLILRILGNFENDQIYHVNCCLNKYKSKKQCYNSHFVSLLMYHFHDNYSILDKFIIYFQKLYMFFNNYYEQII